jgi:hypothetical protein
MDYLEIKPLEGVGSVTFGMTPDEVISILGAEQVYEPWMGGNLNHALLYHGLILMFDRCNSYGPLKDAQLTDIDVHQREDAILFGKPVSDWTKQDLLQHFEERGVESLTPPNGDIVVLQLKLEMSFDESGYLTYIGISEY